MPLLFYILMTSLHDFFFFFFSSRRRHTRSLCDWSSDVCSSDLHHEFRGGTAATTKPTPEHRGVNVHLVRVQTCKPYRSCVVEALELSASPDVAAVGAQINKAVEWLHRRVRKIRNLVLGRDFGGRCL